MGKIEAERTPKGAENGEYIQEVDRKKRILEVQGECQKNEASRGEISD